MAGSAPAHKTTLADWQRTLDVNLTGAFLTVKPALAGMAARKAGRIVFIASTAGLKGYAYVAPYVAAKHGVVGLMRALAAETAKSGVTVNAVCPGFVETDMLEESIQRIIEKTGRSAEQARASLASTNPQGRFIQPRRSRRRRAVAVRRRGGVDHRTGDFHLRRRDMVAGPAARAVRTRQGPAAAVDQAAARLAHRSRPSCASG